MKVYTGIQIGKTCWRCGKPITQYYNILCMDCADELGISEIFVRGMKEDEIKMLVKGRIEKDIKNAVKTIGRKRRLHILWYPLFSKFPACSLNLVFKRMGIE